MIIALINWKIYPDKIAEFETYWKTVVKIKDPSGYVGEFLSKVESGKKLDYITWPLIPESGAYVPYINVGIWNDEKSFRDQIVPKFDDTKAPEEFEFSRRTRTIIRPVAYRIGDAILPSVHSKGVK